MMNLQDVVNRPAVLRLMMSLSQRTPEVVGARLASFLAGVVCRVKPAAYHSLQLNLWQILGPDAGQQTLDRTARQVFYHAIRGYYDLYRALRISREQVASVVDLPEATMAIVRSLRAMERGALLVFPHLGSFDLGGWALASHLPEIQVLSLPDPSPGFQWANELRRQSGARVTPLSAAALRQAIRLLSRGGVVSVAADRPVSDLDEPVPFFGRPAHVPSGHVRLALRTGAIVMITYCILSPETHRYTMHIEPPMEMLRTGDRDEETRINMRRVLDALETVIRRWLEQWQMFVPVWPEHLEV
jgi:lauroyl/myristoyl acyltransferase